VEVIEILVPEQYIPSRAFIFSFKIFLFPSDSGYLNKNTAFLAIFQRHRFQDKVPVPAQGLTFTGRKGPVNTGLKKGHDEYFSVSVLDHLVSISVGLVPEPALCPGAGAADRSQETL
jgi:hypothetical protein